MKKSLNETIDKISKFYFPKSKKTKLINKIRDEVFFVSVDGKQYVIKAYSPNLAKSRIEFFERLQNYSNSKLKISPLIMGTYDGNLNIRLDGLNYDLTEFVPNKELQPHDISNINKFFFDMGLFVGKIHRIFSELDNDEFFNMKSLLYIPPESPDHMRELLEDYKNSNIKDSWKQIVKQKITIVNSFKTGMEMFEDLPKKLVHGDLYLKNILFDNSQQVVGLVDFVQAGIFFRCYEVMRSLIQTNRFFHNIDLQPKHLKSFLKGYSEFSLLDKNELLKMLDFYIYVQASDIAFLDVDSLEKTNPSLQEYAEYRFSSLSSLFKNRRALSQAIFKS